MPKNWRFLELSLPTPDVAASLHFYRALGFTELITGDIRRYPYAVVSDGRIAIGLHGAQLDSPALSFVQPGVATWARQLTAAGFELAFQRLGVEDFHEFGLPGPSGELVVLMEAATFSGADDIPVPLIGRSRHIGLACPTEAATEFWQLAGLGVDDDDVRHGVMLTSPGLRLCLTERGAVGPELHFSTGSLDTALPLLEMHGIDPRRHELGWLLTSPEGTRLILHAD
jgi:catechol 2,3-dioxygenase-like lactoylglutathione lyase family enzyme